MPDFDVEDRLQHGLRYDEYRDHWKGRLEEAPPSGADPSERRMHYYLNYNWDRQADVHEAYTPSNDLRTAIDASNQSRYWMVLTEPWCGDSAFLLPVLAEAADVSENVTLRILLRDDNLDIMDQYLTDGSRSIPKLVSFSSDGEERFTWGPRPEQARERFRALQDQYEEKSEIIAKLLEYYDDGGWKEADGELAAAVRSAVRAPVE